jgi:hypothetical protein
MFGKMTKDFQTHFGRSGRDMAKANWKMPQFLKGDEIGLVSLVFGQALLE